MLEFRYDTQLLIEGKDLDEDAINDYIIENFKATAFWQSEMRSLSRFISTPTSLGRFLNTVLHSARYTISWLRIWTGRQED